MHQVFMTNQIIRGRTDFFKPKALHSTFPSAVFVEKPAYDLCITGVKVPFANAVWQKTDIEEKEINDILETFRRKQLPFFWWDPPIHLLSKADLRAKKGLITGGYLTGVIVDFHAQSLPAANKDIAIREIESSAEMTQFCQVLFAPMGVPSSVLEQIHTILKQSTDSGHDTHFLAFDGTKAIGAVTLSIGETAGIWNLGTLPDMRNRGIGTALIQAALREAQAREYPSCMAILMPDESKNIWQRLHFQEVCYFPFSST